MLQKIVLQCTYEGDQRASYNWGSLFHGFLIKVLPPQVAAKLHDSQVRPFSQYVLPQPDQQLNWIIGLWDTTIAEHIVEMIMPLTQIEIQNKSLNLRVVGIQRTSESETEYFSRFFTDRPPGRRYELEFRTPCTHRQEGTYALFPSSELIVNSLYQRYSAYGQEVSLDDPEAILQLARHIHIVRYSLHSAVYYLESTKITGYMGKITLVVNGPDQLARLAGAMLSFAEYSGVGIKTALGMGGVRIREIP
jgi:CRISPR-associated endoribonuclease Cas6